MQVNPRDFLQIKLKFLAHIVKEFYLTYSLRSFSKDLFHAPQLFHIKMNESELFTVNVCKVTHTFVNSIKICQGCHVGQTKTKTKTKHVF